MDDLRKLAEMIERDGREVKNISDTWLKFEVSQDYVWDRQLRLQHHTNRLLLFIAERLAEISGSTWRQR